MSWEDLLDEGSERVLPWYGFRQIHDAERSWVRQGTRPPEHGWYLFETSGGRGAVLKSTELKDPDSSWADNQPQLRGYLVGDHFIKDNVDPGDYELEQVYCVELGLERFARATVVRDREGRLVYISQEFPQGPEEEVRQFYQDRKDNLTPIANVTPALDLAFRWLWRWRAEQEERRRELERLRAEEEARQAAQERLEKAMKDAGSAAGRRVLATQDFEMAAKEALKVSGAELLDVLDSTRRGEKVVQYRFRQRRLECVVDVKTLRVNDSGICLTDHRTGKKGDNFFTLESLPGVVGEAMDQNKLVVWRHVPGDVDPYDDPYEEDY
jgi:hypothetical protein